MGEKGNVSHDDAPELDAFIANYRKIKDNKTHTQLQPWHFEFPAILLFLVETYNLSCNPIIFSSQAPKST
jgi:hypothetical protein